jgi:hypothetical protein
MKPQNQRALESLESPYLILNKKESSLSNPTIFWLLN